MAHFFAEDVKTQEIPTHLKFFEKYCKNIGHVKPYIKDLTTDKLPFRDLQLLNKTNIFLECKTENYPNKNFCIELISNLPKKLIPGYCLNKRLSKEDVGFQYCVAGIRFSNHDESNLSIGLTKELMRNHKISQYYKPSNLICLFDVRDIQTKIVNKYLKNQECQLIVGITRKSKGHFYSVCMLIPFSNVENYIEYQLNTDELKK